MEIVHYQLGPMDNNTYLIIDEATRDAALIDPSFDSEKLWDDIEARKVQMRYILNTHGHFDHIIGNAFWVEKTGAPLALHRDDLDRLRALPEHARQYRFEAAPSPDPSIFLEDGQTLTLGNTLIRVVHTPGHSPGSVTFLFDDVAIVGDVLFAGSIGRTDFPGCSLQTLLHSIRTQLLTLPDATTVLPGHNEPTTIGQERASNPHLVGL
ncbi:MAG: Zn-dependent hydrolase, including glyoxylase [Chthonomonadaceae bacterium]|nr:Zn-dependent hydrolase, including glyoxylase [Chthonomonadaceae bacterium]